MESFQAKMVDKISGKECSDMTREVVKAESNKYKEEMLAKMQHILANFDGTYGQMLTEIMF